METERLLLRPWHEADARSLFLLASDPEVGPRAGWLPHRSVEESLDVIRTLFNNDHTWAIACRCLPTGNSRTCRVPAVEPTPGGQPASRIVGCICYYPYGESNIDIGPHDAEVGYWIGRPWWNLGIATEALRLIVDHCFNHKRFLSLWADHLPDNPASGRVLQKCGFRPTGLRNLGSRLAVSADSPVQVMRLDQR